MKLHPREFPVQLAHNEIDRAVTEAILVLAETPMSEASPQKI